MPGSDRLSAAPMADLAEASQKNIAGAPYFTAQSDDFWINTVRSLGSNSATDGFASIETLIASHRLSARDLRKLASACRSLMDQAKDAASDMEAREKRPWEFAALTRATGAS